MRSEELAHFLSELNALREDLLPEVVSYATFDTSLYAVTHVTAEEDFKPPLQGGGGTSPRCYWEAIPEWPYEYQCHIVFTDMGIYNWGTAPDAPVIWVSSGRAGPEPPFGRVVNITL